MKSPIINLQLKSKTSVWSKIGLCTIVIPFLLWLISTQWMFIYSTTTLNVSFYNGLFSLDVWQGSALGIPDPYIAGYNLYPALGIEKAIDNIFDDGWLFEYDARGLFVTFPIIAMSLIGLPFLGISHLVRKKRDKAGLCRNCDYNLTGNESGICPECGLGITTTVSLPRNK